MQYIGKIDKIKFTEISNDITVEDVVLTDKQVEHIKERHPNDYEQYFKYIKEIVGRMGLDAEHADVLGLHLAGFGIDAQNRCGIVGPVVFGIAIQPDIF